MKRVINIGHKCSVSLIIPRNGVAKHTGILDRYAGKILYDDLWLSVVYSSVEDFGQCLTCAIGTIGILYFSYDCRELLFIDDDAFFCNTFSRIISTTDLSSL